MSAYQYFVEGECEKRLIKAFMYVSPVSFVDGKVEVFNFVNEKMSNQRARSIKRGTKVVIVFDTDTSSTVTLEYNLSVLERIALVDKKNLFLVPSVNNFEDELLYACNGISNINQLFSTNGLGEFKKKFVAHKDIYSKMISVGFDIDKMWSRNPSGIFTKYTNRSKSLKVRNSK